MKWACSYSINSRHWFIAALEHWSSAHIPNFPQKLTRMVSVEALILSYFLFYFLNCHVAGDLGKCTSTLRKSVFLSPSGSQIPLLGAEVDVLMQRRNTAIGSMYGTHDELYCGMVTKNAICSTSDVDAAKKAFQRFTLQRKIAWLPHLFDIENFCIFTSLVICHLKLTEATAGLTWVYL